MVTSGQNVSALEAQEIGLIGTGCPKDELVSSALQLIEQLQSTGQYVSDRKAIQGARSELKDLESIRLDMIERIDANREIHPMACRLVLEHMLATADGSHDDACHSESLVMARVYGSEPSHGLLNHFFLGDFNRKSPGRVEMKLASKSIKKIGMVGVGLMGASIAEICLSRGHDVVLFDADADQLVTVVDTLQAKHPGSRGCESDRLQQLCKLRPGVGVGRRSRRREKVGIATDRKQYWR